MIAMIAELFFSDRGDRSDRSDHMETSLNAFSCSVANDQLAEGT